MKPIKFLLLACALANAPLARSQSLRIYWIDVEGGGATLIVTPAGESVLIDAGGDDIARDAPRVHHVAADIAGLKQIDYFVATHWHSDHYAGANGLSQLMPMKKFYGPGPFPSSVPENPMFQTDMAGYRKVTHGNSTDLHPGDILRVKQAAGLPAVTMRCLAAGGKAISPATDRPPQNPICRESVAKPLDHTQNANSVVIKLSYGSFTFFDGGDLTWNKEAALVCPTDLVGHIDLLQIDHHGLDRSNNPVLLKTISPQVVVINNGSDKGPEPGCVATLKSLKCVATVWQLHRNVQTGPQLNTDPAYIANPDVKCRAEFIQAAVNADGSFSIQIGRNGTRKLYKAR